MLLACALLLAAAQARAQEWFLGGDISLLPRYEQVGQKYYNRNGLTVPNVLKFLKGTSVGWNAQRVRLFVAPEGDPDPAVCQDLAYVTALGKRIKEEGFAFMLDFHYSDTWADPSHQTVPKAWQELKTATAMADKVYDYTKESLEHLVAEGAAPDFIQVGNEITCGMLWDIGRVNSGSVNNKNNLARILKKAVAACREVCPEAKVIIHLEHIQNASYTVQNFKDLTSRGVEFDILGLSYYPFWHEGLSTLATTLQQLQTNFPDKDVHIVETAYYYANQPAVGEGITYDFSSQWPISADGQAQFAADLVVELKKHDNVKGLFWWFPEENGSGPDNDRVLGGWICRGLWNNTTHKAMPALFELKAFLEREDVGVATPTAQPSQADDWHSLQGFRLSATPAHRGIYLHQGKKVAVK